METVLDEGRDAGKTGIVDEWKRNCDAADVISFDIVDTLNLRNVHKPTDIFEIGGKKIREFSWF